MGEKRVSLLPPYPPPIFPPPPPISNPPPSPPASLLCNPPLYLLLTNIIDTTNAFLGTAISKYEATIIIDKIYTIFRYSNFRTRGGLLELPFEFLAMGSWVLSFGHLRSAVSAEWLSVVQSLAALFVPTNVSITNPFNDDIEQHA
jgi:hypothetical protein